MIRVEAAAPLPFVVPWHALMLVRCAGKDGQTVLTIERALYHFNVCAYVEPLFYDRQWCYATWQQAIRALADYLGDPRAHEPVGWQRAVSLHEGIRRGSGV